MDEIGRVNGIFSHSKTFIVSNSEFLIYSLYAFALLTLTSATSRISCLYASQLELSVDPSALVAGVARTR